MPIERIPAQGSRFEVRFALHLGQKFSDRRVIGPHQHFRVKDRLSCVPSFGHDGEVDIPRLDGGYFRVGGR